MTRRVADMTEDQRRRARESNARRKRKPLTAEQLQAKYEHGVWRQCHEYLGRILDREGIA